MTVQESISNSHPRSVKARGFAPAARSSSLPPIAVWHLASFDAPTVAVVWSLAFAWAIGVRLPVWVPVLLGLVTWSVYIGDRLLDAREGLRSDRLHLLRERHHFHWRHRRVLLPLALAAAGVALCMILALMPPPALERNSVLAAVTLAYFTGVHSPRPTPAATFAKLLSWLQSLFSKELLVGFLFTAGCALPVFSRASKIEWVPLAGMAFGFSLLAWLNCFAIQCWESGRKSTTREPVTVLACLLAIAGLSMAFLLRAREPRLAGLLAAGATSAALLALLDRFRGRMAPVTLRGCADLVLLTPLALLLR
jgi:hypothetical protein